jgi:hypothetical protein
MDARVLLLGAVLTLLPSLTEAQTSTWTYDSKTGTLSGDATSTSRQAAKDIVALELAEYGAWNNHDIQGCLTVYWQSPNLVSIANDEETHGYEALRKEMLQEFAADPSIMGHIDLDTLKIQMLSDDTACCVASYVVKTEHYVYYCDDTATLRHLPEGWKIAFEKATLVTH